MENEVVCRGEQGTSSVYAHVVEVCRGQHAFLRGVVGTGLPCRGSQGVVEVCRGDWSYYVVGTVLACRGHRDTVK